MKISLHTLGCKLNQAETEELKQDLLNRDFSVVPSASGEDVAVIRACGVTGGASQTTREIIRQVKRNGAYVIATGCLENKELPEIDFVGKNNEEILKHLLAFHPTRRGGIQTVDLNHLNFHEEKAKTRAFIKIQTGCNFQCTYCIIPNFRGKSRSVPAKQIINKINQASEAGYKEIVLTGINICQYKYVQNYEKIRKYAFSDRKETNYETTKKYNLTDLLTEILNKTKIQRIRLGSLDPRLISDKLMGSYANKPINQLTNEPLLAPRGEVSGLTAFGLPLRGKPRGILSALARKNKQVCFSLASLDNKRLLPHCHLSLQSGSDTVLKRMARGYTTEQYEKIVNQLRQNYPLFSFTTDIIVGFPGETEKEFEETCEFVKKIGFTKIHIFPFSPRPNTPSAKLKPVTNRIVSERVRLLTKIAGQVASDYRQRFIGLTRPVLFENQTESLRDSTWWQGYTPEYVRVRYKSKQNLQNKIKEIKLTRDHFAVK